jgi:hypothetical protein
MNDAYWSWLREQEEHEESERAAFSGSVAVAERPEIELEHPVPSGFESFWT